MQKHFTLNILFISLLFFLPFYTEGKYQANWDSLSKHTPAPEWYKDAKFGIYCHWGVYCVPKKYSEWYPRNMYKDDHPAFKYHKEKYGDQAEFGYHHFVPMFQAKKFDPDKWAKLVKESGARFAGLVAEHHDGFSMWDSKVNPWNTKKMGPKRDITKELATAYRKQGLKFFTSFHHARHLQRNSMKDNGGGYDSHFIYNKKYHTSSTDPKLRLLYGNMKENEFNQYWFDKLKEVIDAYSPDIIYFDSWLNLVPEKIRQEFCAYYLNSAQKKKQEVVIVYKQYDIPNTIGVNDIEKGGRVELTYPTWMTDDTLCFGSWSYTDTSKVKPANMVLHSLIDIISKNGILLLNMSPHEDGTIPEDQQESLRTIGKWIKKYGEAVYNTRPWLLHGYGPTTARANTHGGMSTKNIFTPEDVRFTMAKNKKAIYIIFLGKPKKGARIKLRHFAPHRYPAPSPVKKIVELSSGKEAKLEITDSAYYMTIPNVSMDEMANVFKMILK